MKTIWMCLAVAVVAGAESLDLNMSDPAAREELVCSGRHSVRADEGWIVLRGGGTLASRKAVGPGEYHVRFCMIEADKFQYHRPAFIFFRGKAGDPTSDGYALRWDSYGLLTLIATRDGKAVHSRRFIHPGRDNPNRYESGQHVDLTVFVPPSGDCVEVYCHRNEAQGEPTCRFKLVDLPLAGHFGWHNPKWYSHVRITSLRWRAP